MCPQDANYERAKKEESRCMNTVGCFPERGNNQRGRKKHEESPSATLSNSRQSHSHSTSRDDKIESCILYNCVRWTNANPLSSITVRGV